MSELNPCIASYLPPPHIGFPESYIHNLNAYKHKFPLILFSDYKWDIGEIHIGNPEAAKSPKNRWAVNNALWLTALKIVDQGKYSHVIFMEADSRVGCDNWDEVMWKEYVKLNPRPPIAGSAVIFNAFGAGLAAAKKYEQFFTKNKRKLIPIPSYGATGSAEKSEPRVFVNGSVAIYDMGLMRELFVFDKSQIQQALNITAFDFVIGQRLWDAYGMNSYDKIHNLACSYSSYGNILTTEDMRKQWLINGDFVAIHQVDGPWKGPRE